MYVIASAKDIDGLNITLFSCINSTNVHLCNYCTKIFVIVVNTCVSRRSVDNKAVILSYHPFIYIVGGYPFKDSRRISGVPWEKIENSIKTRLFNSQHYRYVLCDYMGGSRIFLRRRVPDPDVQIRGARLFRPLDKGVGGGTVSQKNFFGPSSLSLV